MTRWKQRKAPNLVFVDTPTEFFEMTLGKPRRRVELRLLASRMDEDGRVVVLKTPLGIHDVTYEVEGEESFEPPEPEWK